MIFQKSFQYADLVHTHTHTHKNVLSVLKTVELYYISVKKNFTHKMLILITFISDVNMHG